jgi:hypothetical protein
MKDLKFASCKNARFKYQLRRQASGPQAEWRSGIVFANPVPLGEAFTAGRLTR